MRKVLSLAAQILVLSLANQFAWAEQPIRIVIQQSDLDDSPFPDVEAPLIRVLEIAPVQQVESKSPQLEKANALEAEANQLFSEGRYSEAIVKYDEAYQLSKKSELLANIAVSQQYLHEWEQCVAYAELALSKLPAGEKRNHTDGVRATCSARISPNTNSGKSSWRTPVGWTAAALGAASLVTGVIAWQATEDKYNDTDSFKSLATLERVGYGVGYSLLAIGSGLLIWDLILKDQQTQTSHFTVSPTGVMFGLTF